MLEMVANIIVETAVMLAIVVVMRVSSRRNGTSGRHASLCVYCKSYEQWSGRVMPNEVDMFLWILV